MALADIQCDRSDAESAAINTRLILLLANQVGNQQILEQAPTIAGQLHIEE